MRTGLLGRIFRQARKNRVEILSRGENTRARKPRTQNPQQTTNRPEKTGGGNAATKPQEAPIVPLFDGPVRIYVRHWDGRAHVAITRGSTLVEYHVCNRAERDLRVGDIYAGRVLSVKDTYAFVDLGGGERGFISRDDIPDVDPTKPLTEQLKVGDSLLCQVAGLASAASGKGPRLTGRVHLRGRYITVLHSPQNPSKLIVERNVIDPELRRKCYRILENLGQTEYVLVGLDNLAGADEKDAAAIIDEKESLIRRLDTFRAEAVVHAESNEGPKLLEREVDPLMRIIRDRAGTQAEAIVVDRPGVATHIANYLRGLGGNPDIVTVWEGDEDIYDGNGITFQLARAMQREVAIGGGAYLVIDRAEAGVFIDVNTGRGSKRSQHETNLVAAAEIGKQIRVRNIGGMIVVDFAGGSQKNIEEEDTRLDELVHELRRALAGDPALATVVGVEGLHVAIITRKRTNLSLVEEHSETCEHCEGRGVIVNPTPVLGGTAADPKRKHRRRAGNGSGTGGNRNGRSAGGRRSGAARAGARTRRDQGEAESAA